jgi:WD40 repeat protein
MQSRHLFVAVLLILAPEASAQELIERATFRGHRFRVDRAELSPDCKILAAGGGDTRGGDLKLWDASSGREIVSLPGYTNSLYSLAFSADGKRLASGGMGPVQVWDVSARKEIASVKGLWGGTVVVAMNQDATRLGAVAGREVKLCEAASGKELASFRHHIAVHGGPGPAFTSDLATLAAGNYQEIDLWDTATGRRKAILSEHRGEVGCMLWSADDKTLIASSIRHQGRDFKWKGDVKLWDVGSGKERSTLPGPFGRILAMALSSDGKTLALLDSPALHEDFDLKLVDVATSRQRAVHAPLGYTFLSLRFTAQGKLLLLGARVETLRLWEVSSGRKKGKP